MSEAEQRSKPAPVAFGAPLASDCVAPTALPGLLPRSPRRRSLGRARLEVYQWARKGIVLPPVSNGREKLWSYADLMTLRVVAWQRGRKSDGQFPGATSQVRAAFENLSRQGIDLWDDSREPPSVLYVKQDGRIVIRTDTSTSSIDEQGTLPDTLDLLAPFAHGVTAGPDLRRPRQLLRIVPGKCSGEPHVHETRITTSTLASLFERGYDLDDVAALYPQEPRQALAQAHDLEQHLRSAA